MPIRMRRNPGFFAPSLETVTDHDDCFAVHKGAGYMARIIERYPALDHYSLEFCCWLLGPGVNDLNEKVISLLSRSGADRFEQEIEDSVDCDDLARSIIKAVRHDRNRAGKLIRILSDLLKQRQNETGTFNKSQLKKNSRIFQKIFSLSDEELELCLFIFLVETWENYRDFFSSRLRIYDYPGHKYLRAALGFSPAELDKVLRGSLLQIGIITRGNMGINFEEDFLRIFIEPGTSDSMENLYARAKISPIPLKYHMVAPEEISHIQALLSTKNKTPAHILLYGPAGTGKTSFARSIAASVHGLAYEITQDEKNKSSKRRAGLQACLNMTNHGDGSVIIIDEADNLLNTMNPFFMGEVHDKGWLNNLLDEPGVRAIWIVNHTEMIEESVLRRFSYSLHFPNFSRQKRIQLWETVVRHNNVSRYIKGDNLRQLANDYEVSAGIIDLAVKQAANVRSSHKLPVYKGVRMALDAHLRLQNQGLLPTAKKILDPDFSLKGLNIAGNIDEALVQAKRFSAMFRQNEHKFIRQYNLLFYGPPGTGKSETAKYLAMELDRDLMVRTGSDLLDKYVGETEKRIAGMFAEAEAREAVLVVDEADSFIFGREMAHRSWEVTMVNEFLTCMESYRGILICTTNRIQGLDMASIRRFNNKLRFDYLDSNGTMIFYDKFLSRLCPGEPDTGMTARLRSIAGLTPGDFKNVRNIYLMKDKGISHKDLITALEQEARLKEQQTAGRTVGF